MPALKFCSNMREFRMRPVFHALALVFDYWPKFGFHLFLVLQAIIFDGGVHYLAVGRSRPEPVPYLQDLCSGQVVKRKTLFDGLSQWVCAHAELLQVGAVVYFCCCGPAGIR